MAFLTVFMAGLLALGVFLVLHAVGVDLGLAGWFGVGLICGVVVLLPLD